MRRSVVSVFTMIGTAILAPLWLSACSTVMDLALEDPADIQAASGSFPYNPLIYHLDLSILAYQIYDQSLVWRFDPYYEEMNDKNDGRARTMEKVRAWAKLKGSEQVSQQAGLDSYRGPGVLSGFADNPSHDPILYNYSRIFPWGDSISKALNRWTEYSTPREITGQIDDVYVCYRKIGQPLSNVAIDKLPAPDSGPAPGASDTLLAFEGGTGDKGERERAASQSLMGLILVRNTPGGGYDLHVAFRGSRSGSGSRAIAQAFSTKKASGNPDWITDLGYNRLTSDADAARISRIGSVHRGFARSMKFILPNLFRCLTEVATLRKGASPGNIYVTGHSLGGALAQNFVAAMLLGNKYGPDGTGPAMPAALRTWPWKQVKLITYGAPRVGNETFAKALTVEKLQSEFFSTAINPIDTAALKATDPSILPRLLDPQRPAGYRVLNSKDPITTEKVVGGKHVGKTIYVNTPSPRDALPPPDFSAHEQRQIRDYMLASIKDPKAPAIAIRYRKMAEINPARKARKKGSPEEVSKLATAAKRYYLNRQIWLDHAAYDQEVQLRLSIAGSR